MTETGPKSAGGSLYDSYQNRRKDLIRWAYLKPKSRGKRGKDFWINLDEGFLITIFL